MVRSDHVFGNALFDVSFEGPGDAAERSAALQELVSGPLLAVVEEVCDEMAAAGTVIRIDRLEVDLGRIPQGEVGTEMPRRLRAELRRAVAARLREEGPDGEQPARAVGEHQASLEDILHVLATGRLTWSAETAEAPDFDEMATRVMAATAPDVVAFLQAHAADDAVIQRAVQQLPEAALRGLLTAMPSGPQLVRLRKTFESATRRSSLPRPARRALELHFWRSFVGQLLRDPSPGNPANLARSILAATERSAGRDYAELVARLTRAVDEVFAVRDTAPAATAPTATASQEETVDPKNGATVDVPMDEGALLPFGGEGAQARQHIGLHERAREENDSEVDPWTRRQRGARYEGQLIDAWLGGGIATLQEDWASILRERPELIVSTLRRYAHRAGVRRGIAERLPATMFMDLVHTLDPAAGAHVREWLKHARLFTVRDKGAPPDVTPDQQVREHTLTHLLESDGRVFDEEEYLRGLIARVAANTHVAPGAVHASVAAGCQALDEGGSFRDEALALLSGIDVESLVSDPGTTDEHEREREHQTGAIRAMGSEEDGGIAPPSGFDELTAKDRSRVFEARLADGLRGERIADLQAVWPDLMRDRPDLIELAVLRNARRVDVQRRLAERLPRAMFEDIVKVLDPDATTAVIAWLEHTELFEIDSGRASDSAILETRVRANVLSCLVSDPTPFDEPLFVASLIVRMADDSGVKPAQLQASIVEKLGTLGLAGSFASRALTLLAETDLQHAPPTTPRIHENPDGRRDWEDGERSRLTSASLMQAYELIESVEASARGRAPGRPSGSVSAAVGTLAREHPRRLLSMVRELVSDEAALALCVEYLTDVDLAAMVDAWLNARAAARPGHDPDDWTDLREAIFRFSARTPNRRQYYVVILECLVSEALLDFDRILARSTGESEVEEGVSTSRGSPGYPPRGMTFPINVVQSETHESALGLEDLARFLDHGVRSTRVTPARLTTFLESLFRDSEGRLRAWLYPRLRSSQARERFVGVFPEGLLARTLHLLRPDAWGDARTVADLITEACLTAAQSTAAAGVRAVTWAFIFDALLEGGRPFEEGDFARELTLHLARHLGRHDEAEFRSQIRASLRMNASPSDGPLPFRLASALAGARAGTGGADRDSALDQAAPLRVRDEITPSPLDPQTDIRITNAGLVLAAPYLPRLFTMLGLAGPNGFIDAAKTSRAAQLMQFVVTGDQDTPEFQLSLNKILCGLPSHSPVARRLDLEAREAEAIEGLLSAMIGHWEALGTTSVAGLRDSFLQRGGTLRLVDDAWRLDVDSRPFDMLLDRVPWTFKTIRFPWMRHVLQVEWR